MVLASPDSDAGYKGQPLSAAAAAADTSSTSSSSSSMVLDEEGSAARRLPNQVCLRSLPALSLSLSSSLAFPFPLLLPSPLCIVTIFPAPPRPNGLAPAGRCGTALFRSAVVGCSSEFCVAAVGDPASKFSDRLQIDPSASPPCFIGEGATADNTAGVFSPMTVVFPKPPRPNPPSVSTDRFLTTSRTGAIGTPSSSTPSPFVIADVKLGATDDVRTLELVLEFVLVLVGVVAPPLSASMARSFPFPLPFLKTTFPAPPLPKTCSGFSTGLSVSIVTLVGIIKVKAGGCLPTSKLGDAPNVSPSFFFRGKDVNGMESVIFGLDDHKWNVCV